MKRIVIIGGGITGLATAHRLRELARETSRRLELIVVEARGRLGGVIQTEQIKIEQNEGFLLEHGPDSFLSEKPETLALARRLGIDSHIQQTNHEYRRSFIVNRGLLRPIPEGFNLMAPARLWPFFVSDIISWQGKARMALDLLLPKGRVNDESLAAFVRRRFGREALERIAQPLIGGIYTADPEQLSLSATMPRFLEMERNDRSLIRSLQKRGKEENKTAEARGARYSLFLTFDLGMQLLVDRLAVSQNDNASIQLNTRVVSLARDSESAEWMIKDSSGSSLRADGVCLALTAPAAANLLGDIDQPLAQELQAIPYASTATINLAFNRTDVSHPLDGFGFVVPFIEKRSLLACTFSSVKFADRAPEGSVLLRAFVGGALQPDLFTLDEGEMTQRVLSDLRDLLGIRKAPLFARVAKWERSMPQYHLGHLDRVGRIEKLAAKLPNFVLAGNAYAGAGISDCIREGERAADKIFGSVRDERV